VQLVAQVVTVSTVVTVLFSGRVDDPLQAELARDLDPAAVFDLIQLLQSSLADDAATKMFTRSKTHRPSFADCPSDGPRVNAETLPFFLFARCSRRNNP